ncbi:hypothetical protein ANN_16473 [Periplaneta americana]|uniref:Uncharacterized protein n=1 Tax=Periplaneta americana TaxID=6978 RepID=A0ABQ8SJH7_PERAM|nr:hypothetical protein ANN_16473 [Periplaneta americana]
MTFAKKTMNHKYTLSNRTLRLEKDTKFTTCDVYLFIFVRDRAYLLGFRTKPIREHNNTRHTFVNIIVLKPIWTYGIQLWRTAGNSNIEILQRYQSKTLRSIVTAPWTDRLDTATCTHTLLSTDVHIRTDHVRYTLRYLHCFSVVSCPHPSDSALNGILLEHIKTLEKIQKRALKCCRKNSPLKWDTLTDRRTRIRLCALFKTYRATQRAYQRECGVRNPPSPKKHTGTGKQIGNNWISGENFHTYNLPENVVVSIGSSAVHSQSAVPTASTSTSQPDYAEEGDDEEIIFFSAYLKSRMERDGVCLVWSEMRREEEESEWKERIRNLSAEQSDGITVFRISPMASLMLHRCRTGAISLQRYLYPYDIVHCCVMALLLPVQEINCLCSPFFERDGSTEISQNFASVAQTTTCTIAMTAINPSRRFVPNSLQRDVIVVHRTGEIRNTLKVGGYKVGVVGVEVQDSIRILKVIR